MRTRYEYEDQDDFNAYCHLLSLLRSGCKVVFSAYLDDSYDPETGYDGMTVDEEYIDIDDQTFEPHELGRLGDLIRRLMWDDDEFPEVMCVFLRHDYIIEYEVHLKETDDV